MLDESATARAQWALFMSQGEGPYPISSGQPLKGFRRGVT